MYYSESNRTVSLPANLSNPELAERVKAALSPYGAISGVKTSRDLKNRPFAFVQFEVSHILIHARLVYCYLSCIFN